MSIVKSPLITLNMCCLSKETREQIHMLSWPRQLLLWAASFLGPAAARRPEMTGGCHKGISLEQPGERHGSLHLQHAPSSVHLCKQELWLQKSLGSLWASWGASLVLLKETLLHPQINNFQRLAKSLHKHLISPWPQCL